MTIAPVEETANKLVCDIVDLIVADSGYTIKSYQNSPRPPADYADVGVNSILNRGWDVRAYSNQVLPGIDLIETITGYREFLFTINFYRTNAINRAHTVYTGINKSSILAVLRQASFGFTRRSEVRNLTQAIAAEWEERAQLDITLNSVSTDTEIVKSIMTVDIAGEFQARGLQYPITIEVA